MKGRLSGVLLPFMFLCAILVCTGTSSSAYATRQPKHAVQQECKEKLQTFGNELILIIGSNSSQNEKITKVASLIEAHKLFDKDDLCKRSCGKKHYKALVKYDTDFLSKFLRYAVKTVLLSIETFNTKQSMKFVVQKKSVSKGDKIEYNATIHTEKGQTVVLTIVMNPKNATIYDIRVEGATTLCTMLKSQFKAILDSKIKRARPGESKRDLYIEFAREISHSNVSE